MCLENKKNNVRKTREIVRRINANMCANERESTQYSNEVIAHYYSIRYTDIQGGQKAVIQGVHNYSLM